MSFGTLTKLKAGVANVFGYRLIPMLTYQKHPFTYNNTCNFKAHNYTRLCMAPHHVPQFLAIGLHNSHEKYWHRRCLYVPLSDTVSIYLSACAYTRPWLQSLLGTRYYNREGHFPCLHVLCRRSVCSLSSWGSIRAGLADVWVESEATHMLAVICSCSDRALQVAWAVVM